MGKRKWQTIFRTAYDARSEIKTLYRYASRAFQERIPARRHGLEFSRDRNTCGFGRKDKNHQRILRKREWHWNLNMA